MLPTIKPIDNRIFVKRDLDDDMTKGGIALTEKSISFKMTGTVVAVGPGALRTFPKELEDSETFDEADRYPMTIKVGDKVLLPHIQNNLVGLDPDDDKNVLFHYSENQVLAVLS